MSKKKAKSEQSAQDIRYALEQDIAAFLKAGKKIQKIPTGVSGQEQTSGRRHLVLGHGKKS